jgi:hypothetical protein
MNSKDDLEVIQLFDTQVENKSHVSGHGNAGAISRMRCS